MSFRVGRIATGDDFLVSPYNYIFVQNGFDGNPVGIFFNAPGMTAYPNATWGALLKVRPTERTYVMGGWYNGDPSTRANKHHGLDWSLDGQLFTIEEVGTNATACRATPACSATTKPASGTITAASQTLTLPDAVWPRTTNAGTGASMVCSTKC